MASGIELITSNSGMVGLFTILITLSVTLSKIIEFLIKKAIPKKKKVLSDKESEKIDDIYALIEAILRKKEEESEKLKEQYEWVHEMYRLHNKVDGDGIPLWYVPRSFLDNQKEIVTILLSISSQMDKSSYILDNILKNLEELKTNIREINKK